MMFHRAWVSKWHSIVLALDMSTTLSSEMFCLCQGDCLPPCGQCNYHTHYGMYFYH